MKKMTTIIVTLLVTLTAQAQTIWQIADAYKHDKPLQETRGTFTEAMSLINSTDRNRVIRGKNILTKLAQSSELSENRKNAVSAAIKYADDRLDSIDRWPK